MASTIEFNQGDDYEFNLSGFNPDNNYKVYIQFFDEDGNFVGNQLETTSNYSETVPIRLLASFTDLLTVPTGEDYQLYYMGGKKVEIIETVQNLFAWKLSTDIIYTHTVEPAVDDAVYDADNEDTGDTISAVTGDEEITAITVDSSTYSRSEADDTSVVTDTSLANEKTVISDLGNKRPVIVYKKRVEGPV